MIHRLLLVWLLSSRFVVLAAPFLGVCYYNVGNTSFSQDQYQSEFSAVQNLPRTLGWDAALLFTSLGSNDQGISPAIDAAVATQTQLSIMICAMPVNNICNITIELNAIQAAASKYGSSFTNLLQGIVVTDYAISTDYNDPSSVATMITEVRNKLSGTSLQSTPIGTREVPETWVTSSMQQIIDVSDFIFVRIYPATVSTISNVTSGIAYAKSSLSAVQDVAGGKPVWVSTGWPNTNNGTTLNFSVSPSVTDAKSYYDAFGCGVLFNEVSTIWSTIEPTWWGDDLLNSSGYPVHDLSCPQKSSSSVQGSMSQLSTSTAQSSTSTAQSLSTDRSTSAAAQPSSTVPGSSTSGISSARGGMLNEPTQLGLEIGLAVGLGVPLLTLLAMLAYLSCKHRKGTELSKHTVPSSLSSYASSYIDFRLDRRTEDWVEDDSRRLTPVVLEIRTEGASPPPPPAYESHFRTTSSNGTRVDPR